MEELLQENERLKRENRELRELIKRLEEQVKSLQGQLGQNSRNSHWSSSRDKSRVKRKSKSLRKKSEKKAGGQRGHQGHTLEYREQPDKIEKHRPQVCRHCQVGYGEEAEVVDVSRRQVVDLPPLRFLTIEHQVETLCCPNCGGETSAVYPEGVTNPVQYGIRVKQLAVYLRNEQFIPYERSRQLFAEVFQLQLSPGSLQNFNGLAGGRAQGVYASLKEAICESAVGHVDETGFYVNGKRQWLHVAGTPALTYYASHEKRGKAATDAIGILPQFRGTMVHDNWATYWAYEKASHALCNVHHLRELTAIEEQFEQAWARRFKWFLLASKQVVDDAKASGLSALPAHKCAQIEGIYSQLLTQALQANPSPEGGWPQGKRGRPKKSKARNFAERLQQRRSAVLAFVYDFKVPFDNNLAERDIRMMKVQQKVSGCFRSSEGAEQFCVIRSYISTVRKQGLSVWQALGSLFQGDILLPSLIPV